MLAGTAQAERLCEYASELAPLAGSQASRDARSALALAYTALAQLLPELRNSSALLTELNAMSTTEVLPPIKSASLLLVELVLMGSCKGQSEHRRLLSFI